MPRIKKDDEVVVIAGKNKGMRGTVLRVLPKSSRVVVQGVNVVTKHVKPDRANPQGGIQRREAPIHISNVMVADPESGQPTRTRITKLESGRRVRTAVRSGAQLDK
jgi:large subunit ribosomal protein L24